MKYLLILFTLISVTAGAQNYADSTITITSTQRLAGFIARAIREKPSWEDRKMPDVMKNFVGSGNNQDSVFTVTIKARHLFAGISQLIDRPLLLMYSDYRSIMMNLPVIVGYTPMVTQIQTIAAGITSQKLAAQWVIDMYQQRVNAYNALDTEEKSAVQTWKNN